MSRPSSVGKVAVRVLSSLYLPWYTSPSSSSADFFMAQLYILQIDNWYQWYDLNIPDEAWITLAQNSEFETLIEIVDPLWRVAFEIATPDFVQTICID